MNPQLNKKKTSFFKKKCKTSILRCWHTTNGVDTQLTVLTK